MKRLILLATFAAGCATGPLATDRAVLVRNVAGRPYLSARYRSLCQPEIVQGIDAKCRTLKNVVNKIVDDNELAKQSRALGPLLPEQKAELKADLKAARTALRAVQKIALRPPILAKKEKTP